MQVILLERVEHLGQMGQIVRVKPGYARNYLIPQKKALRATKDNLTYFEAQRVQFEATNLQRRQEAEAVAEKMAGATVTMIRSAGEGGQLYGSVSARDVADALGAAGYTVGRQQVAIERPIKTLGLFDLRVVLHPEVSTKVIVNVARSHDEAALQLQQGGALTAEDIEALADAAVPPEEPPAEPAAADDSPVGTVDP